MRMDEHIKRLIQKHTLEASRTSGREALDHYETAYAQAKELGNPFTLRACAANLGAMLVSLGSREAAQKGLKYLSEALPPEGTLDCVSNGDLYFNMGLGLEVVGLLERAHASLERAWEEYRSERDNVAMEVATLKRLLQISQTRERYDDAVKWCQLLEETYRLSQRPVDQLAITQQRVMLQRRREDERAPEAVQECIQLLGEIQQRGKLTVGILIQMSVMLAHFKQPQAAREYLEKANDLLVGVEHRGGLEKAVVLQNLGTLCNCLDDWAASLHHHRQAAAIYQHFAALTPDPASPIQPLAALRCQGHCIANHAYALAKLDDVDEARVLFSKALELAAQCGDLDTKWQMAEALGAVHFRLACHDLDDLPSPRQLTSNVRVGLPASRLKHLEKSLDWYKTALMDLASAAGGSGGGGGMTAMSSVQDRVLEKYTLVKTFKDNVVLARSGEVAQLYHLPAPPQAQTQVINNAEGVAKETAAEIPAPERAQENVVEESSSGSESGDDDDDDEETDDEGEETREGSSSTDREDEEGLPLGKTLRTPAEEDEDREQVKALYEAQLGEGGTLQGTEKLRTVRADVHAQHVSSSAESASTDDDEGSEDDSEDETDDESDKEEEKKARNLPPVPAESPPQTLMPSGTYETPQNAGVESQINELYGPATPQPHSGAYADIDFEAKAKQRSAGPSRLDNLDSDYEAMEMRPRSPPERLNVHRSRQSDEAVDFEMGGSYLTHGEEKPQKDSKTCVIM